MIFFIVFDRTRQRGQPRRQIAPFYFFVFQTNRFPCMVKRRRTDEIDAAQNSKTNRKPRKAALRHAKRQPARSSAVRAVRLPAKYE